MLLQRAKHEWTDCAWQEILSSGLDDTGTLPPSQGQEAAKIEVVREDDVVSFTCPMENLCIVGFRVANVGPVDGAKLVSLQELAPPRRQVHVDHEAQAGLRATSRSSTRHVAYWRAALMSSGSR